MTANIPDITPTVPVTFRIPAGLHDWLRRAAFDARRPMNALVVQALEELRERAGG